mgnify:FL=1
MELPEGLKYSKNHIWLKRDGKTVKLGITDYAQDELGDVVFVDLPREGETYDMEDVFGTVESIKTVSDLFMPIKGEFISINENLMDNPELVNEDPYGKGWIAEVEIIEENTNLLTREEYESKVLD